jgi:hypothetical protein
MLNVDFLSSLLDGLPQLLLTGQGQLSAVHRESIPIPKPGNSILESDEILT